MPEAESVFAHFLCTTMAASRCFHSPSSARTNISRKTCCCSGTRRTGLPASGPRGCRQNRARNSMMRSPSLGSDIGAEERVELVLFGLRLLDVNDTLDGPQTVQHGPFGTEDTINQRMRL